MQNKILFQKKESLAKELIQKNNEFSFDLSFSYHEVPIRLYTSSRELITFLKGWLPASWLKKPNGEVLDIFHYNPLEFSLEEFQFEDEESSECFDGKLGDWRLGIQRDFVAVEKAQKSHVIFHHEQTDGFFNYLRWLLPPMILEKNKVIFHSSCALKSNGKALVFFGPSGAGKTTTVSLAGERAILGDDMNTLVFKEDGVFIQVGAVGGLYPPQVDFDQLFSIEGLFWLVQDEENQIQNIPLSDQMSRVMGSMANLFWEHLSERQTQIGLDLAQALVEKCKVQALHFKKDPSVWQFLDP